MQNIKNPSDACSLTNLTKIEGGSPRGNDTGGPNGIPGGGKSGKNGRGRGRSSGASPRGRSPHIEPDILGGRIPAS